MTHSISIIIAIIKKANKGIDRGGKTEAGDDSMLHNEAQELLVERYAKNHDASAIAQAYEPFPFYCPVKREWLTPSLR